MADDWRFELFAKNTGCCERNFCGCYVYSRVAHRLEIFPLEPEYEEEPYNAMCTTGILPFAICLQRRDIRARFDIKGDSSEDYMHSCCCPNLVVVQHELELIDRCQQGPPVTTEEYQSTRNAMVYPPKADSRERT